MLCLLGGCAASGTGDKMALNDSDRSAQPATKDDTIVFEFGVSRERIRQIEVRAFEKLQKAVRDQAATMNLLPQEDMAGLLPA